ncbi:hypothetical protein Plhal304r1_c008g0033601 [Plasmopara halstedii]
MRVLSANMWAMCSSRKNGRKTQWHVYRNINTTATEKEALTWFVELSRLLPGQSGAQNCHALTRCCT